MEPQANTAQYDKVPAEWPGASKLFKYAKSATLTNWVLYLIVSVVGGILSSVITNDRDASISILVGANLVALLVSTFVAACTTNIELKNVLHEKTDFNRVLSAAANRYLGFLGMTIMLYVLLTLCALAFLVPLFIVGPRVSLAQYFYFDQNLSPMEAIKASWEATSGNVGKVWGIIGMCLLYALIAVTIIGIPVAIYLLFMFSSAPALLYMWLKPGKQTGPVAPSAPVAPAPVA